MRQQILVIEQVRIAPKDEAEFTGFFHHAYLPEILQRPEVLGINRYEEYGTRGSLAWFSKSYLTVYELAADLQSIPDFEKIVRQIPESLKKEMDRWKKDHFTFFFRDLYQQLYTHERGANDPIFDRRPFFVVTVETEGNAKEEFHSWYNNKYLPKTMADIPMWNGCRRYASVTRSPAHYHTIYKAENILDLEKGFDLLRAAYRFSSNADWDNWVGSAISSQNASSFQPIFHRPG